MAALIEEILAKYEELTNSFGATHRAPYTPQAQMWDVIRKNAVPHQPKHCACQACTYGFTHIAQVTR